METHAADISPAIHAPGFTRADTDVAKGSAILAMFVHHLYLHPELPGFGFTSIVPGWPFAQPAEWYAAILGKVCVAAFLFLSGYGLAKSAARDDRSTIRYAAGKLASFYLHYWVIFAVFIPLGLWVVRAPVAAHWNLRELGLMLVGLSPGHIAPWWFVYCYAAMLLLMPAMLWLAQKNALLLLLLSALAAYAAHRLPPMIEVVASWQASFVIGILFSRLSIYERLCDRAFPRVSLFTVFAVASLCLLLRWRLGGTEIDPFLVPWLVYFCGRMPGRWLRAPLALCGRYCLAMWLCHTFITHYYWTDLVYAPKLSILILLWLFILCLPTSMAITWLGGRVESACRAAWGGLSRRALRHGDTEEWQGSLPAGRPS